MNKTRINWKYNKTQLLQEHQRFISCLEWRQTCFPAEAVVTRSCFRKVPSPRRASRGGSPAARWHRWLHYRPSPSLPALLHEKAFSLACPDVVFAKGCGFGLKTEDDKFYSEDSAGLRSRVTWWCSLIAHQQVWASSIRWVISVLLDHRCFLKEL